jgi:hypothetical protein
MRPVSQRQQGASHVKKIIPALLLGLAAVASLPSHATPILTTINLDTVYAGNTPDGPAPWLIATFTSNTGSNTGKLTLTSVVDDSDFLQGLSSKKSALGWGFFLDNEIATITCDSSPGSNCTSNVLWDGGYNAGPLGKNWNLAFGWGVNSRFESGDTAVYDITFNSALTDSPFVTNPNDDAHGWLSVAHVQGITGECSGWIVAGNGKDAAGDGPCTSVFITEVPEPPLLGMFGLGALMIGLFAGRRRRQQQGC